MTAAIQTPDAQRAQDAALTRRLMFPDASDDELRLALLVCQKYGLDPLLRHVVLIKQRAREGQPEKRNLYVTRDGLLHIAHQSEKLDGIVLEGDVTETKDEWRCRVSVHRKDMSKPFTYPGRYPKAGQNARYGPEMAVKVGEVMALRRAFDVALLAREEVTDDEIALPEAQGEEAITAGSVEPRPDGSIPGITPTPGSDVPLFSPRIENSARVMRRLKDAITASGLPREQIQSLSQTLFGQSDSKALTLEQLETLAGELEGLAHSRGA